VCTKRLRHAVEALVEIRPPDDATTTYGFVTPEWARQWPSEEA
jgi:hypothetical protein